MSREKSPTANSGAGADRFGQAARPTVMGMAGVVSTGHYLASSAGMEMLQRGGNAIDAGVAAGLCLNVVHNDMNTLSGVAPIAIYSSREGRATTLAGVGTWPANISRARLEKIHGGIPDSLERCVVPAAAASWLQALRRYGSLSFDEVSAPARRYAHDGFPVHTFMHHAIHKYLHTYRTWEENRRIFLVNDAPPLVGTIVRQPDLHWTLSRMVAAESSMLGSERGERIQNVADTFYRGEIAQSMISFSSTHGGLLTAEDLANYDVHEEQEVEISFGEWSAVTCGPWSQGPTMAFALNILRHFDLKAFRHNSAAYVNVVASALDLAFADRNAFCGDPKFVDVPLDSLLSNDYGHLRATLIQLDQGFKAPQPPGDPYNLQPILAEKLFGREDFGAPTPYPSADTSCVTVVDSQGNFFAATPSDGYCNGPIIPGLGLHISERGSQSFLNPSDPNVVAPGKRPRLTPNPVLILRHGEPWYALATPGNDRQVQAMLQVFLNIALFDMSPQEAVEAPRFATYNFRASSWPGNLEPGRLCLEEGIDESVVQMLSEGGRRIMRWPRWCWSAGGVCLAGKTETGVLVGAADPRRESYAIAL